MYKCYKIPTIDIAIILDKLEQLTGDLQTKDLIKEANRLYIITNELKEIAQNNKEITTAKEYLKIKRKAKANNKINNSTIKNNYIY